MIFGASKAVESYVELDEAFALTAAYFKPGQTGYFAVGDKGWMVVLAPLRWYQRWPILRHVFKRRATVWPVEVMEDHDG